MTNENSHADCRQAGSHRCESILPLGVAQASDGRATSSGISKSEVIAEPLAIAENGGILAPLRVGVNANWLGRSARIPTKIRRQVRDQCERGTPWQLWESG